MDMRPEPFVPPAPEPRTVPPSRLEVIRTVMRNPLELWGKPSYTLPWIETKFLKERTLIVNDPGLIRHILVDNSANYEMSEIRQLILRPILRDGLLTAEGPVWKRSRKAMAPVFTPRHSRGFAGQMLAKSEEYVEKYAADHPSGAVHDISVDMTELAFAILSETLFSGEIVTESEKFSDDVDSLLHRMGRVDPMDLLRAPPWVPRVTRIGGQRVLDKFRKVVADTMIQRQKRIRETPDAVPQDFLTLLLQLEGPDGLTMAEIEDNILTFIGAGHETTARALALDSVLRRPVAACARCDGNGDRSGLGRRGRTGRLAGENALGEGGFRGSAAALSAGAFHQPRGNPWRSLDQPDGRDRDHRCGRDGSRHAMDTASA